MSAGAPLAGGSAGGVPAGRVFAGRGLADGVVTGAVPGRGREDPVEESAGSFAFSGISLRVFRHKWILMWWDSPIPRSIPRDPHGERVRPPRALIPLLAVTGAAAVVATAGAGAAIEKIPAAGPALADTTDEEAPPPVSVNAVTWNVCGDTGCPLGARPGELAAEIARRLAGSEVGGRTVPMNAVFLQEVCSGHVDTLKETARLRSWSWAFAAYRTAGGAERTCANGQGRFGVAVGTQAPMSDVKEVRLPSPDRHGRSAVCGTVESWHARLCGVRLSTARWDDDPRGRWRGKQVAALGRLVSEERVIIGGDFTERPDSPVLDPLYRDFAECDQGPNESRSGAMTQQDGTGAAIAKTDYLFITKTASASCYVSNTPTRASDHRPLAGSVRFR